MIAILRESCSLFCIPTKITHDLTAVDIIHTHNCCHLKFTKKNTSLHLKSRFISLHFPVWLCTLNPIQTFPMNIKYVEFNSFNMQCNFINIKEWKYVYAMILIFLLKTRNKITVYSLTPYST